MSDYYGNGWDAPVQDTVAQDQYPGFSGGFDEYVEQLKREGRFPLNATSRAYEASHVVKTGGGQLYGFSGYNSGPAQWIQVLDAQTLLADGAIPGPILEVATLSAFAMDWGDVGRNFYVGIVILCSTTGPTKTLGSANCWFDVQYV